jgi:SulP family sulfate permease
VGYTPRKARLDLQAGINVALLTFPQAMAYALIAGMPVQFGLYAAAVAGLVTPFFSSSRFVVLGPTNATAVLMLSVFMVLPPGVNRLEVIPLFLLMVGAFLVLGSVFRVATLVQYVSQTVVTGYICAAAVLIIAHQIPALLGLQVDAGSTLLDLLVNTAARLDETQAAPLLLGASTGVVYTVMGKKFPRLPRVVLTLVLMSLLGALVFASGSPLVFLEEVKPGSWNVSLPQINPQNLSLLASAALAVAFLSVVETTSIGKSLANRAGDRLDPNQEMLSLGLGNTASAFFGGMPVSGSLTRSVLNYNSGAVSPASTWICALLIGAAALTLGPMIAWIPQAVLAALVIGVAVSLIHADQIRYAIRSTRSDRITFWVTFLSGLVLSVDFAIYLGVAVSIILFLRKASAPTLVEYSFNDQGNLYEIGDKSTRAHPCISIVHVEGELFFGAAELFRDQIRFVSEDPNLKIIILRLKNAYHLDATSVMALEELIRYLREQNRHLIVSGARKEVYRVLRNSGLLEVLGRENFFIGSPANPNVSTRNALKRAQELLGHEKAEVKIFYDPTKSPTRDP